MRAARTEDFETDAHTADRAAAANIALAGAPTEERAQVLRTRPGVAGADEGQWTTTLPVHIPA